MHTAKQDLILGQICVHVSKEAYYSCKKIGRNSQASAVCLNSSTRKAQTNK